MASSTRIRTPNRLRLAGAATLAVVALLTAPASASASALDRPAESRSVPGFLLERGRFTTADAPRRDWDITPTGIGPLGINDDGDIVGEYDDSDDSEHGYLLHGRRFRTIDVPGAAGTQVSKVNDRGVAVGTYSDTVDDLDVANGTFRGFLWERGRFTRLDVPGAVQTQARGINEDREVVGEYQTADGTFHGFRWKRGRFTTVDAPGAAGTSLTDINDRGQILGLRVEADGTGRGVVLDRGRATSFSVPDRNFVFPLDITNRGQIVGFGFDSDDPFGTIRSFVLERGARGPLTTIRRPGRPATVVTGINDRHQIIGGTVDPDTMPAPTVDAT